MKRQDPPLIVITGPTASGKSDLAMKLAKCWGGEIICADSRTIYKGLDIGTAKPSRLDRSQVRHWLVDVAYPDERFTVQDFQQQALDAIQDIKKRGKIPFLVGGTGLYIDSVILEYQFGSDIDPEERAWLETLSIESLILLLKKHHLSLPNNSKNKRHLIRCYEKRNDTTSRKTTIDANTHVVAITVKKDVLMSRIKARTDRMFDDNIVQETQQLFETYPSQSEAHTGNIYPIVWSWLNGIFTKSEAVERCIVSDRQLAKRQITWLKRHDFVQWYSVDEAEQYFDHILAKYRDVQKEK